MTLEVGKNFFKNVIFMLSQEVTVPGANSYNQSLEWKSFHLQNVPIYGDWGHARTYHFKFLQVLVWIFHGHPMVFENMMQQTRLQFELLGLALSCPRILNA